MPKLQWKWNSGQSIVFVALILIILIGFTGLAIDTGRAYQRQRTIQASANASSVAGLNALNNNRTDDLIVNAVRQSMLTNGIGTADKLVAVNNFEWGVDAGTVYFTAEYINSTGGFLGNVGSFGTGQAPNGVAFIRVTASEGVPTSFSRALGQETFTVSADGAAGKINCVTGVYPVSWDQSNLSGKKPLAYAAWDLPASTLTNGSYQNSIIKITPATNGKFDFLKWRQNDGMTAFTQSMQEPGNLVNGFDEGTPQATDAVAQNQLNGQMEINDYIWGANLAPTPAQANVTKLINNGVRLVIPLNDKALETGTPNVRYHVASFAQVRLVSATLTGSNKQMSFALLNTNPMCTGNVASPPTVTGITDVTIYVNEELRWIVPPVPGQNYNLALVMDYSASMKFCWQNNNSCPTGTRRIDYEIPAARRLIQSMLVTRPANDPSVDNQMALVRFGVKIGGKMTAEMLVPFTKDPQPFWNRIGVPGSSYTVPASELNGNTPTATGLNSAITLLNASRKKDKNGNDVKMVVLLLTDGLSNVLFDAPYIGVPNDKNGPSGSCITGSKPMDDPAIQSSCPKNSNPARPPITASIDEADRGRALGMSFYAVALAEPDGLTLEQLFLTRIADKAYKANSTSDLDAMVDGIAQELAGACTQDKAPLRLASGATVTITRQDGTYVTKGTVDVEGKVVFALPPDTYKLSVIHENVIAPEDAAQKPRTYSRVAYPSTSPQPSLSFTVENLDLKLDQVTLFIDNDNAASCDYPNWPN